MAVKTAVYSIDKYCGQHNHGGLTITKNVGVHGGPGTGKSRGGQLGVLYPILQRLWTILACLMSSWENAIGGTHLHKWIFVFNSKYTKHPYKAAQKVL